MGSSTSENGEPTKAKTPDETATTVDNDTPEESSTKQTETKAESETSKETNRAKNTDTRQERLNKPQAARSIASSSNAANVGQESKTNEQGKTTGYRATGQTHHHHQQQHQQQQQQQHHSQHYANFGHHNAHHNSHNHQHHHHHHSHNNQHPNQHHQHNQYNNDILSKTNLYIRGLGAETTDSDLYSLCSRFGSIVSTKAILDKSTNKCKGYGFVDFETSEAAEMAVTELQKQGVLVHMAKAQDADPTNLYIANLPQTMTDSELENLLKPFGQVVSTRILVNQNRQPRGVGFARMETKEQCDSIIASLHCQVIKGSKEPLLVKFADGANKKRPHHFQHKPLGGTQSFMGNHSRRNNSNDSNHYHMMNSAGGGNRNFHGGSFAEQSRQNHSISHHDNALLKHQQMLTSMPGYHPHQSGGHHSYMMQQNTQMMAPTSAIDPSLHYVNLANQMQGLQIGNHPVGGYMSPQQWPPVWPGVTGTFTNTTNSSRDALLR